MKYIEKIIRVIRNYPLISGLNNDNFLRVFCPHLPVAIMNDFRERSSQLFRKKPWKPSAKNSYQLMHPP